MLPLLRDANAKGSLLHAPVAGPAGNAPASGGLEAPLVLHHEPLSYGYPKMPGGIRTRNGRLVDGAPPAPRTRIELVSAGRQPARDTSRVTRQKEPGRVIALSRSPVVRL
jgi:hypothetical protein